MAVRIRMNLIGKKNSPFYRIGAYESRCPRNGKCLEILGWYDPKNQKTDKQLHVNIQRAEYWISVGALPTHKTGLLLKKAGVRMSK
ncbi:MAG: 30S ribosomal protein S16 [Candidatus Brocadiae bacterium]|nr:30S ribosomal protein S16 [Candidatus Brocadiia bacterium]